MSDLRQTEVLVAVGGPSEVAAAIAARQAGFEVAVVDCGHPPIDKACVEGIMPDGLAALAAVFPAALVTAFAAPCCTRRSWTEL
jgi:flavin-dependent dehydrogenase